MIVKSFTADTVAGALKIVRSELGGDAVILKTRKLDAAERAVTGGKIEVTACVDKQPAGSEAAVTVPAAAVAEGPERFEPRVAFPSIPTEAIARKLDLLIDIFQMPVRAGAFPGNIGRLFAAMLQADFPEKMAHDMAEKLSGRFDPEDDYVAIAAAAADLLAAQLPERQAEYELKAGHRIAIIGPAGAGKTSLMGRLAGYLVGTRHQAVCLTSLDQVKVSAPEELQTYADILDVDHFEMPRRVDPTLLERQGKDKVTVIDTPSLNARDREAIDLHAEKLTRIKPRRVIGVFPVIFRSSDLYDMVRAYRPLNLTELAFTMADQTSRLGGMIALSILTGLPITMLGTGYRAGCVELMPDLERIIRVMLGIENGGADE